MHRSIAIIGAGFSGTATAVHLLARHGELPLTIALINRHASLGRGVAYGTHSPSHLLNVPAGRMSLFPDRENDFLEFAYRRDNAVTAASFVPRSLYGEYLHARLDAAAAQAPKMRLTIMTGEVTALNLEHHYAVLDFADRRQLQADRVVLAVGNYPPSNPPVPDHGVIASGRYVRDPWSPGALDDIPMDRPVLLIGTGHTMVDMALELDRRGFRASLMALSRRGLLPQPHRDQPARTQLPPPAELFAGPASIHHYLRSVHAAVKKGTQHDHDWRDVVAALRPVTQALWQALPDAERRRFLRHLQPYWDTHRHRTAPATATRLHALRASGHLQIRAGRLLELRPGGNDIDVRWQPRGHTLSEQFHVACVINCTGPETRLNRLSDPLICNLLAQKLLTPDRLGLGVAINSEGAAFDGTSQASHVIYYTGPLLRARDWECTAVPELRVAALRLADHLALSSVTDNPTDSHDKLSP
ncbi:MAG: FAD/NAD(P)-binding protein [Gammaproteobacteria bacterium]